MRYVQNMADTFGVPKKIKEGIQNMTGMQNMALRTPVYKMWEVITTGSLIISTNITTVYG